MVLPALLGPHVQGVRVAAPTRAWRRPTLRRRGHLALPGPPRSSQLPDVPTILGLRDGGFAVRTRRELQALGEMIFEGLKEGSIALQDVPDQAAIEKKSYETIEEVVGIVLHGHLPHEFQVAVVEAWLGSWEVWERSSQPASVTLEKYRELFLSELFRLIPHEPDADPS